MKESTRRHRPEYTIKLRQDTVENWTRGNPVLKRGEMGYEIGTGKLKVGNGSTRWDDLDYHLPEEDVRALIQQAIAESPSTGEAAMAALTVHINSNRPHSIYDDGPSLLLLYQNAKV